ncbi:TPA: PD-(D/E)XK nuclease family protein [Yersinia enterocolitica]
MEQKNSTLAKWLPNFFQQWPQNLAHARETEKKINIDSNQLAEFFSQLSEPLKAVQHRSLSFDPWEIAGLGRKEVRNTGVLAWLLDPSGSHGFGRLPLQAFLQSIRDCGREDIPKDFNRYCRVRVETNPTGDNTNRVDIEIDADNFFLLIEVKIDAGEQKEQISHYCSDARQRAVQRPWVVVFLTPHGGKPLTSGLEFNAEDVPCLSWWHLAAAMESSLQLSYRQIVTANNASPMRQMAAHAAFCFLRRARKF